MFLNFISIPTMPFICIPTLFKSCPCLFSIVMINTIIKSNLEKTGFLLLLHFVLLCFLSLSTWVTFYHWGKSEQKPKAGTWRKELKQKLWRDATYWIAQHSLLYKPWHLFNYNVLGLPTFIINQENIPQDLLTGQSYVAFLTLDSLFPDDPSCVKSTK